MSEFMSPTGDGIQGTSESVLAASACTFGDTAGDYDHSGGSEVWWDTMTTETIEGVALFTDESGDDWLEHHLLPDGPNVLEDQQIALLKDELRIGRALEAARELYKAPALMLGDKAAVNAIIASLHTRYVNAKERAVDAVKAVAELNEKEEA